MSKEWLLTGGHEASQMLGPQYLLLSEPQALPNFV